ncbi:scoloptoxin SSD552-like [Hetaerina americana]|uniref:scoloptoxin SSD552-like n=1 Tax=Hetaerina americana TaxID=62018 RepID=UPI003A7F1403
MTAPCAAPTSAAECDEPTTRRLPRAPEPGPAPAPWPPSPPSHRRHVSQGVAREEGVRSQEGCWRTSLCKCQFLMYDIGLSTRRSATAAGSNIAMLRARPQKRQVFMQLFRSVLRAVMPMSSSPGGTPTLKALLLLLLLVVLSSPAWAYGGKSFMSSGQLSCGDKQQILSMHNQMRQRVANGQVHGQPPAANMKEMVWDDELARIAQNWANQGRVSHNSPRSSRFTVGENIAATWTYGHPSPSGSSPDFRKCISDWFAEVSYFPSSNVRQYQFSHSTGHYSQLVWGDTYLVGCGYSYYVDPQKGYTKFYVCNYGPAGNIVGGQLYHSGAPSCSSFGLYPSGRYSGLCEVPGSNPPGPVCSASSAGYYSGPRQPYYPQPYYYGR